MTPEELRRVADLLGIAKRNALMLSHVCEIDELIPKLKNLANRPAPLGMTTTLNLTVEQTRMLMAVLERERNLLNIMGTYKFEWGFIAPEFNFAVMESNGQWWVSDKRPRLTNTTWMYADSAKVLYVERPPFLVGGWRNSLQVRP